MNSAKNTVQPALCANGMLKYAILLSTFLLFFSTFSKAQNPVSIENALPGNGPVITKITLHHLSRMNQIKNYPHLQKILNEYRAKMKHELTKGKEVIIDRYPILGTDVNQIIASL